jgi:hypothetical protein
LHDQSQATNAGTITVSGNFFDGISMGGNGNNNTVINRGTIITSGTFSESIFTLGSGNTLLNQASGTIITQENDSPAVHAFGGSNNVLTNAGAIMTSGDRRSSPAERPRTGCSAMATTTRSSTTGRSRSPARMLTA